MKVVIFAGGYGTRISEESYLKPKPMIEIGGMPILWHIMKLYSHYGHNDFIICAGYKQNVIKEWFNNYRINMSDVVFDFETGTKKIIGTHAKENWKVSVIDTGLDTKTGGRLLKIKRLIGDEPFLLTYGDGVANVDINEVIKFHRSQSKTVTVTAVRPEGRFGILEIEGDEIKSFHEKRKEDAGWINGGFMVVEPEALDYIENPDMMFEAEPLVRIAEDGELCCYRHNGFWQCMDTMRDKERLEALYKSDRIPWKVW
ncbi:MAG: glucose-1-phosphate cytidylyltransferase [Eubacteriales bacterium]